MRRISTEYFADGTTLSRVVDVDDNDIVVVTEYNPDGTVLSSTPLIGVEPPPPFPSLDESGALATLLAVNGTITVEEAANVEHVSVAHIEHEALAWGVG